MPIWTNIPDNMKFLDIKLSQNPRDSLINLQRHRLGHNHWFLPGNADRTEASFIDIYFSFLTYFLTQY